MSTVSPSSMGTWPAPRGGEAALGSGPASGLRGLFITGTDTEIGKTSITAGLTYLLAEAGFRAAPIKPLAAGQELVDGAWVNDDVQRLQAAQRLGMSADQVGPLQFRAACAPHIAAALEGQRIQRAPLLAAIRASAALGELALVEGVGGFRVPLCAPRPAASHQAPQGGGNKLGAARRLFLEGEGFDTADLAQDLGLPVVLVVGLRLGCINHALLTAEAVRARGLRLGGWVANTVDAAMPHVADNLAALDAALAAPCWGHVPRLSDPSAAAVAAHLNLERVQASLAASAT